MRVSKIPSIRHDGRKQLVLLLPPELINELKMDALKRGVHTYEVAEAALTDYLKSRASVTRD